MRFWACCKSVLNLCLAVAVLLVAGTLVREGVKLNLPQPLQVQAEGPPSVHLVILQPPQLCQPEPEKLPSVISKPKLNGCCR